MPLYCSYNGNNVKFKVSIVDIWVLPTIKKMKYYTLHVDDSGAIAEIEERTVNGIKMSFCKMYDDEEFNSLNDIIHSTSNYILNSKALKIFKTSNTKPFKSRNAVVLRRENYLCFFKKYKRHNYFELTLSDDVYKNTCYDWIDFEKSEIYAIDNTKEKRKIKTHIETLGFIKNNSPNSTKRREIENSELSVISKQRELLKYKSYSFETIKIVFNNRFDTNKDLFRIQLYSWGVYVSERFKEKLINAGISDIGFAESKKDLGIVWKPHYPIIEFVE